MLDGHSSLQSNAPSAHQESDRPKKGQLVRLATADDIEPVMGLLRLMHAEVGEEEMDEVKVRERVEYCLKEGFLCVATSDEQPIGACGLLFTSFWYSRATHLADTFFYIHSERRQSSYASKLKRFCDGLAIHMQMKLYWTCVVTRTRSARRDGASETERKAAFFGRHARKYAEVYVGGLS